MKKILKKANALLSCVLALTLIVGFFSCINVKAAGPVENDGKITVKAYVYWEDEYGKRQPAENVTVNLHFVDFGGEVEDVLSDGWDAILAKLGKDEKSIFYWASNHEEFKSVVTGADGYATFTLDSGIDWIYRFSTSDLSKTYTDACNYIPYLPYGRVGVVIPGLLQRKMCIPVTKIPPKDDGTVVVVPDDEHTTPSAIDATPLTPATPIKPTKPTTPAGGTTGTSPADDPSTGNGTGRPSDPLYSGDTPIGELLDEPNMEVVEPEFIDIMDENGQALGDAVSKDPQVITYDGGSDKKAKKDNGTKLVAKADTTPSANTDDTQYTDLDGDDTARGNTDIPEDEAKEEKKETVNFVAKVDDTKKDDTPAVAPATTEVKEEVSNPITELATQAGEGVSPKFWLLWIIVGLVLVGGGVTIYLKRRR